MPDSSSFFARKRLKLWSTIFCATILMGAATIACSANLAPESSQRVRSYFVYAGTYTGPSSKGIYVYRFDERQGRLTPLGLAAETSNPSFVVADPANRHLYVVNEMSEPGPDAYRVHGYISSFAIDPGNGSLKFLNKVSSGGGGPCHLTLDRTGKILFVANYGSGNVASFAIQDDGSIGAMTGFDQHTGSSVNPQRQEGPHAHAVVISPDNRFLFVPDLGLDRIMIYRIDSAKRTFARNTPAYVSVNPGLGPRHFAFGAGARFAYALCEMGSSVVVFSYDSASGKLTPIQTISTLPAGFSGEDNSAEIEVSKSGRFLYASNRGNDSITEFQIDSKTGLLTKGQITPTQGKTPRNFVIDPTGRYLLAANQESNSIVVFRIDPSNGRLTPANQTVDCPAPVSLLFVPEASAPTAAHSAE
jgi:6-phosphogluconolactonase